MPVNPTYPGVYIQEIPSGVRTITGVATSITAFIGRALRGPTNKAMTITSYSDFERIFGGLWVKSMLGYAVRDFYLNGGSTAIIVRLFHPYYQDKATRDAIVAAAKEVVDAINASAAVAPADIAQAGTVVAGQINGDANRSAEAKTVANAVAKAGADAAATAGADKAKIVKAAQDATDAAVPLTKTPLTVGGLPLEAAYEGSWGNSLMAKVDTNVSADFATSIGLTSDDLFNLIVQEGINGQQEVFRNLTLKNSSRRIDKVLEASSKLVRWADPVPPKPDLLVALKQQFTADPTLKEVLDDKQNAIAAAQAEGKTKKNELDVAQKALDNAITTKKAQNEIDLATATRDTAKTALGTANRDLAAANATSLATDGSGITSLDFVAPGYLDKKIGLYALEQADLFNILCIPPFVLNSDVYDMDLPLLADAAAYCSDRRAMLLIDPQSNWKDRDAALTGVQAIVEPIGSDNAKNAAFYFPRLKEANILRNNQIESFAPCGAMAGIFARTDTQRGVWKAPAGLEAGVTGVSGLDVLLTDNENGLLNPHAINCLRIFPAAGAVVWGARTLQGNDQLASEWKYVPVRRTALFLEESLYRGLKWVVFEPNDEPLWAQIRLNVGAFMHNLFVKGAFQGATPRDAYFVKCDKETTTQNDIDLGIVNIVVGFAPLKPAEFVIISLQQIAGQIQV